MKKKILIILNGKPQSGKDTFVENAAKKLDVENLSSVDLVKDVATILGWDGVKTPEARNFLSEVKDSWTKYNNGPFKYIVNKVQNSGAVVIFAHLREPEEIAKLYNHFFDSSTILPIKLCVSSNRVEVDSTNHADNNTDNVDYDFIIENNGTLEEFEKATLSLMWNLYSCIDIE